MGGIDINSMMSSREGALEIAGPVATVISETALATALIIINFMMQFRPKEQSES